MQETEVTAPADPKPSYKGNAAILLQSYETVNGARAREYGQPKACFERIAAYWSLYLQKEVKAADVCYLMALLKLAREENRHKADNLLDMAGYVGLAADMTAEANQ